MQTPTSTDAGWPTEWMRGALAVCVLHVIADGPTYGYAIASALSDAGLGTVKGGTLYPLLGRLEEAGLVSVEWRAGESGPGRKFYAITPHVEDEWTQAFLLELRLRGVDGRRIGSALAEVEAHCAESGESARSAFGDPEAYAADLAPAPAPASPDLARDVARSVLGLAGMLLTLAAIGAWSSGTEVELTAGFLAVSALVVLGTVLVVRLAEPLLRAVVKHWWVAVVGGGAPVALFVAVLVAWRQAVVSVPVLPSLVV